LGDRRQGWVFAAAKSIFAGTVEKTGKNRGKNQQKLEISYIKPDGNTQV